MDQSDYTEKSTLVMADDNVERTKNVDVDEYITYIGEYGKYQILLVLSICVIIIPSTYPTLIMSFIGNNPPWRCVQHTSNAIQECTLKGHIGSSDKNYNDRCKMNRSSWEFTKPKDFSIVTDWDLVCEKEYLSYLANSALFIGWGFACLFIGYASDRFGRKTIFYPLFTSLMVTGFISSFVSSVGPFIFLRVLIGASSASLFVLAIELVGPKYRSLAGITVWMGFTVALCLMALQAWLVQRWRTLTMITTAPYLIFLLSYIFVPESVRWLRANNRIKEATDILQKVAKVNKKMVPDNIKLSPPRDGEKPHGSFIDLFRPSSMATSSVIQGFTWFVNAQVYYGISLASDQLGGDMYRDFVLTSLVEIPANILTVYCTNRFGRKPTVCSTMVAGGVTCIAVAFFPTDTSTMKAVRVALGMLGKLFITISFNSLTIWSVELYPTVIRAQGMAYLTIVSRIGGASAPWVAQFLRPVHRVLPFTVMGVLTLISAVFTFKLKETLNLATAETLETMSCQNGDRRNQVKFSDVELKGMAKDDDH